MRQANFFYRGVEDASVAVSEGVAQGLLEAFPLPDDMQLPDRLQELVALLIKRDEQGHGEQPKDDLREAVAIEL